MINRVRVSILRDYAKVLRKHIESATIPKCDYDETVDQTTNSCDQLLRHDVDMNRNCLHRSSSMKRKLLKTVQFKTSTI